MPNTATAWLCRVASSAFSAPTSSEGMAAIMHEGTPTA